MNNIDTDIRIRLVNLGEKLRNAEAHLKMMRPMTADNKITNVELQARYDELLKQVGEKRSDDSHHQLVNELEYSIKLWLANVDNGVF